MKTNTKACEYQIFVWLQESSLHTVDYRVDHMTRAREERE